MNTEQELRLAAWQERIAEARLWLSTLGGADAFATEQLLSELAQVASLTARDEQAEVVGPVAFLSAGQFETLGPDPDDGGGAAYLPIRHTAAGNFQMALYRAPPAVAAGGVTAEGIVAALVATEFHRSQIQGFYAKDAGTHYIRDCTKPHDQQRIWSARSNEGSDYDLMHARMMERIELERWRIVLAALAVGDEGIWEGAKALGETP